METLTFTCKIITPMFLAGADGQTPELRAASIKGALRFWWRAISQETNLQKLREEESNIFGGAGLGGDGKGAKRSKVVVRVEPVGRMNISQKPLHQGTQYQLSTPGTGHVANVLEYLAYGPVPKPGEMVKSYFEAGNTFKIIINCPLNLVNELNDIVALMSFFGGLGSRSRNGYGCFLVEELKDCSLKSLFKKYNSGNMKTYTAFSSESQLFELPNFCDKWEDALFGAGKAYRSGRLSLEDRHFGSKRKYISQPLNIKASQSGNNKLYLPKNNKPIERYSKCFFIGLTIIDGDPQKLKSHILFLPHEFDSASVADQKEYKAINDTLASKISTLIK